MIYEWDEAKRATNLVKHGVDFELVREFDWDSAAQQQDMRADYGETRWRAFGLIGDVVHLVVYTRRDGRVRLISARRANRKEALIYVESHPRPYSH